MLVQMLTERVANGGSYNLTFGESLTMAGIGMLVVFMELIILALIIMLMGKVVSSIAGKKGNAAPAAKAAPAAAPVKAAAPALTEDTVGFLGAAAKAVVGMAKQLSSISNARHTDKVFFIISLLLKSLKSV